MEVSRELQFEIWNHGKPHVIPPHGEGREMFLSREKEVEKVIVNKESMAFLWLSPWYEGVSFLPVGCESSPFWSPSSNWDFCLLLLYVCVCVCVCISSCWLTSFSENITDQGSDFLVSAGFCPLVPGQIFPECNELCQRKNAQTGNLLRSHSSNKEG